MLFWVLHCVCLNRRIPCFTSNMILLSRNFLQLVFSGEDDGRVLKYDPKTKETIVLLRNIQFPNGLSLSKDGTFFVFCEGSLGRYIHFSYVMPFSFCISVHVCSSLFTNMLRQLWQQIWWINGFEIFSVF